MSTSSYVPLFELAKGGLGRVEVVMRHDGSYERLYVKKRPHARDAQTRATFLDEARLAGLLRHPNVVGVLDVGEDGEGPYLVMDFVEGVHVGELIRALGGEPIPLGIALDVIRQAAEGLHAVHELQTLDGTPLGVIHRDVSPQNLLIGFDGVVRLTDFGIALADRRHGDATSIGVVKGKVGYTAPEQLEGGELDRRTDLFALGVVLVELLTGARLYQASTNAEVARRIFEDDPSDLGALRRDAPPELVELVFDLLAKTKESRPTSAREVAQRLRAIRDELDEDESLDELMSELFSERRVALQSRVREARDRRLRGVLEARARRASRRTLARVGLATTALLVVLAFGFVLTQEREPSASSELVVSTPLSPRESAPREEESEEATTDDGEPMLEADDAPGEVARAEDGVGSVGPATITTETNASRTLATAGEAATDDESTRAPSEHASVDAPTPRRGNVRTARPRARPASIESRGTTEGEPAPPARPSLPPTSWWPRE